VGVGAGLQKAVLQCPVGLRVCNTQLRGAEIGGFYSTQLRGAEVGAGGFVEVFGEAGRGSTRQADMRLPQCSGCRGRAVEGCSAVPDRGLVVWDSTALN
jgi:hypothetical protein